MVKLSFMDIYDGVFMSLSFSHSLSPQPAHFTVTAPGRVNLIGEHTDYNEGLVLPMAIDKYIRLTVTRINEPVIVLSSDLEAGEIRLPLDRPLQPGNKDWSCYAAGVIAQFQRAGWQLPGFSAHVSSTLPAGGGLSSSAALEVAFATAIEALSGRMLEPLEKALLAQRAEHEFAGVPCGIMDQFAVTFGQEDHALLLDCRDRTMRHVPIGGGETAILIVNSGVKHSLADGEYAKRRADCESAARLLGVASLREVSLARWHEEQAKLPLLEQKRARHVITEHVRTLEFVKALEARDWLTAGEAMYGSHESLSGDYEVSCKELDLLVAISRGIGGVHGCRMTGGGFGGCVVALIERSSADDIMGEFRSRYRQTTGIDPEMFVTRAACGPRVLAAE